MVYLRKKTLCVYLLVSAVLCIPGSYSESEVEIDEPSESKVNTRDVLKSRPESNDLLKQEQINDAQVGDSCTEEAWTQLTKPFWEQNFNKDRSESEAIYIKAHTGWEDNPELAGKACFNNRHVRSGGQIFPALPLKCKAGKCVCYNDVLGSKKFKLYQTEIKYQGSDNTLEDSLADCVGNTGSNCNGVLFPCAPDNSCKLQKSGHYECVSMKPAKTVAPAQTLKKQGKMINPSVKKEIRNDKAKVDIKENIPGVNAAVSFVASGITVLSLGLFASRFI